MNERRGDSKKKIPFSANKKITVDKVYLTPPDQAGWHLASPPSHEVSWQRGPIPRQ
jgi:hypothetical protein